MSKFSRLTLSAVLLTAVALPAMASVPAPHRAPAKAHVTRGPIRHIAATTAAAPAASTATTATAPVAGTVATAPGTVSKPGVAVTSPSATGTAPVAGVATPAKPAVKVN